MPRNVTQRSTPAPNRRSEPENPATTRSSKRGRYAEGIRNDRLLLDAAREVFATQGADAPVSAVAERAGVGIASLYRRYSGKEELLQRLCVLAMEQTIEAAQEALEQQDPWLGLTHYIQRCIAHRAGALAPVAGTIEVDEEMRRTSQKAMALADAVIARAHAAGMLRRDVTTLDISLLIEHFSRRPSMGAPDEDTNIQQRLLAIALAGLRPPAGDTLEPLPGHPPDRERYAARWQKS